MLLGYNHNIPYKGTVFHIQTEDSGIKNPHVITLLYRDGVILCSKKTSYADILQIEGLEAVVEDLMKEQHKEMLRRLKNGEFDEKAFGGAVKAAPVVVESTTPVAIQPSPSVAVPPVVPPQPHQELSDSGIELLFQEQVQGTAEKTPDVSREPEKKEKVASLDDAILNFFGASR